MTRPCGSCVCSSPTRNGVGGRLVLATAVDHTATALRSLGLRRGTPLRVLEPGLLELRGPDLAAFLADARDALSSVEAEEVRCVMVAAGTSDRAMLAQALTAPTLAMAGARVEHADLLPLFDDEDTCFTCVYQPIGDLDTWDAERIAGRAADDLLATLVRPVPVPDGVVQLAGSIGLALLPAHGATAESLLAHADAAMYRSKARRARPSGVG